MRPECNTAARWTLAQAGRTYSGHWHGDNGVCDDGTIFRAGRGWLGFTESQQLINNLCGRRLPRQPQYPAVRRAITVSRHHSRGDFQPRCEVCGKPTYRGQRRCEPCERCYGLAGWPEVLDILSTDDVVIGRVLAHIPSEQS